MPTEEMVRGLGDEDYAYYMGLIENGSTPEEAWESVENVQLLKGPDDEDFFAAYRARFSKPIIISPQMNRSR